MIPVAFDYVRPTSVGEAVSALRAAGDEGKVLAGGQSLMPVLRLRLAGPSMIVDLGWDRRTAGHPSRRRLALYRLDGDARRSGGVDCGPVRGAAGGGGRRQDSVTGSTALGARWAGRWRTPTRPVT
jgi:hypothetical protein